MRLIDADALTEAIGKLPFGDMSSEALAMAFQIHDMICDAPTIKVTPVHHCNNTDFKSQLIKNMIFEERR